RGEVNPVGELARHPSAGRKQQVFCLIERPVKIVVVHAADVRVFPEVREGIETHIPCSARVRYVGGQKKVWLEACGLARANSGTVFDNAELLPFMGLPVEIGPNVFKTFRPSKGDEYPAHP